MRRFSEALRLASKVNDQAASSDSLSARDVLVVARFEIVLLSSHETHDVLLCTEDAAAHTESQKQNPPFNEHAFCSYAFPLLQKLKTVHLFACEKDLFIFENLLLTELPQTGTFSLPVRK